MSSEAFDNGSSVFDADFFTINDVSITVITISTKLPLNLSTNNSDRLGIGAKLGWKSPTEAMPWVGLYICIASLVCTLAMAADAFQGIRLNVFRVEKQWIQRLQMWKSSHVSSHILGRHCKMVFHNIKNMILNIFIAVQITVVVIWNIICLIPITFMIFLCCTYYFCKSLLRSFKEESDEYNIHMR
ncbi:unnamed protein product [Lactuca saligna]|uniref:Uncharacterized protein n=1 Tax=Lactuca saligna TaxID=75948 RepID=A0AA35V6M6_LACSI|nr:unnamed protein product [Lactuca saligna]